jgi:3-oxoadipate enol-lactonase
VSLALDDMGRGPAVVLLHGSPSSVADFRPVVAALVDDHRVLVPELPGYGASPRLDPPYAFERVYAAIEAALVARGIESIAVVGFSQGGHHALALAVRRGRIAVARVVCLAGYAALSADDRAAMLGFAAMMEQPGASLTAPELVAMLAPRFLAPAAAADPAARAQLERWLAATTPAVVADELRAIVRSDLRAALPGLDVPVLARVGALDAAVPPHYSEEIARLCPRGRLEVIPGVGHAQMIEQPAATAAAIRAALA